MKLAIWYLAVIATVSIYTVSITKEAKERSLALQQSQIETLQAKSEKCAKKASNFAYIIDKKLYSEESAARIYETCLNE